MNSLDSVWPLLLFRIVKGREGVIRHVPGKEEHFKIRNVIRACKIERGFYMVSQYK
jgi:hypothetical protein